MPEPDPRIVLLGLTIRKARRDRDLSQEAVGLRTGIDSSLISRVERGVVDAQTTTILRIIEGLGMTPGELYALYDDPRVPGS